MGVHHSDPSPVLGGGARGGGVAADTLVHVLRRRALHQSDQRAYTFLVHGGTEGATLTYGQLDRRARTIAARLQGMGTVGQRVLLLYPPGLDYVAALFGSLYAGMIAVPSYPPRRNRSDPRLRAIVTDAQAAMVLTTTRLLPDLQHRLAHAPQLSALPWLTTDDLSADLAPRWRPPAMDGHTLAICQYTSGSTSTPKGVIIAHRNLLHNLARISHSFQHTSHSRGVIWLPPYHDMGLVGGILQPLYAGFPVVLMAPFDILHDPLCWLRAVSHYKATTSGGPNFAYDLCVDKITPEQRSTLDLSSWQVAFNGAEPVRPRTLQRFAEAFAPCGFRYRAFYPCYGLAEATLLVSAGAVGAGSVVRSFDKAALESGSVVQAAADDNSISLVGCGQSLPGQQIVIAQPESLTRCPPDRVGEIWVSGPSVARGYWNRPAETESTFHACLSDTGEGPFLRTGDLGFWVEKELFIAGRSKDLIIIRGRNYYPQDIELCAETSHPALQPGCGAAFSVDVQDQERLVIVHELKRTQRHADVEEVAHAIRQAVAEDHDLQVYAVLLIRPMSIPRTSSGKIQRYLCRAAFVNGTLKVVGSSILGCVRPAHGSQPLSREMLCALWPQERQPGVESYLREQVARVLGASFSQPGLRTPLVSLGLDSLTAVELQRCIAADLGVAIPAVSLLEGLSISELATRVLEQLIEPRPGAQLPPLEPASRDRDLPLSLAQERLWLLDQLAPGKPVYNIPTALCIEGRLDVGALERSLARIVGRHEALRTRFAIADARPIQVVASGANLRLAVIDVAALSEVRREGEIRRLIARAAWSPFALDRGPLMRANLIRSHSVRHVLVLTMHHIISDLWSVRVLLRELAALYEATSGGRLLPLNELPVQYADFCAWQRQCLPRQVLQGQLSYWREQLAAAPPGLPLPTDRPRPPAQSFRGAIHSFRLSPALVASLGELGRKEGITLFMALLAAFKTMLYRSTGQEDILVGSPTKGRTHPQVENLIGLFAHPLVLRTDLSGDPTFRELLLRVREVALAAYAHQDVPFAEVVRVAQPQRKGNYAPLFQVMFNLVGSPISGLEIPGLTLSLLDVECGLADFDLFLIVIEEKAAGLRAILRYSTDLFDAHTIEHMAAFYCAILERSVRCPQTRLSRFELPHQLEDKVRAARARDRELGFPNLLGSARTDKVGAVRAPDRERTIAVAATFTAEPLQESLAFWMRKLAMPCPIEFAPYNQVFQQLLDPSSLLSLNRGYNVVLLRFEDWQRFEARSIAGSASLADVDGEIEHSVADLVAALGSASQRSAAPYLVFLCPASPSAFADPGRAAFFKRMEDRLLSGLAALAGVYVVTPLELNALYPVSRTCDPYADELGHIPYTSTFFAALGTMIARRVYAISTPPYKVIVLDCDRTLWSGVCGEDGALGVEIDLPRKALQEFMVAQHDAGMLLCLCSKNAERDVMETFEQHPEMPLKRDHIVSSRINWRPKSENIKSLASELQLGLDSFIFLDDDPVECLEVQTYCPQVLVLQLPPQSDRIPRFLNHVWVFDHLKVTETDRERNVFYGQNLERERFREESPTLVGFLAGLKLRVRISELMPEHLSRVAQLTQRTNQFNVSTIRRTESEIRCLDPSGALEWLVVEVRDRFGDYGLVGAMAFEHRSDALYVDTFLLSCRALGKGVEDRMLERLVEAARTRGCAHIDIPYIPTARNQPAADFLQRVSARIGARFEPLPANGFTFRVPVDHSQ